MRVWLNQTLRGHMPLTDVVGTRIYPTTRIREDESTRELEKPFVVHRIAENRGVLRGNEVDLVKYADVQLFFHDTPGDYMQIDSLIEIVSGLFDQYNDPANNIVRVEWLENSDDFRDDDMGTIMRYSRYQVKYKYIPGQGPEDFYGGGYT